MDLSTVPGLLGLGVGGPGRGQHVDRGGHRHGHRRPVHVFKRFGRGARSDRYYLAMTRLFALVSIVCGTLFAMLIPRFGGMIPFYVVLTGTFFLPLTVPYLGGALYPKASRGSGMASLVGGILLGSVLFLGADASPPVLGHPQTAAVLGVGVRLGGVLRLERGREPPARLHPRDRAGEHLEPPGPGPPGPPEDAAQVLRAFRRSLGKDAKTWTSTRSGECPRTLRGTPIPRRSSWPR